MEGWWQRAEPWLHSYSRHVSTSLSVYQTLRCGWGGSVRHNLLIKSSKVTYHAHIYLSIYSYLTIKGYMVSFCLSVCPELVTKCVNIRMWQTDTEQSGRGEPADVLCSYFKLTNHEQIIIEIEASQHGGDRQWPSLSPEARHEDLSGGEVGEVRPDPPGHRQHKLPAIPNVTPATVPEPAGQQRWQVSLPSSLAVSWHDLQSVVTSSEDEARGKWVSYRAGVAEGNNSWFS